MASSPAPPPGLQQEAISAYGMLMEANQAPSLGGSAETPYDYDWPDDDRISESRLREDGMGLELLSFWICGKATKGE